MMCVVVPSGGGGESSLSEEEEEEDMRSRTPDFISFDRLRFGFLK